MWIDSPFGIFFFPEAVRYIYLFNSFISGLSPQCGPKAPPVLLLSSKQRFETGSSRYWTNTLNHDTTLARQYAIWLLLLRQPFGAWLHPLWQPLWGDITTPSPSPNSKGAHGLKKVGDPWVTATAEQEKPQTTHHRSTESTSLNWPRPYRAPKSPLPGPRGFLGPDQEPSLWHTSHSPPTL